MPRFNLSASVHSNNGATPRRGGRVPGQVVSSYRSYVPPAGDRILEARTIVSPERAWETNVCGIDGCQKVCVLRNRAENGRLTYYCAGGLDIDENGDTIGHPGRKSRVCTYNSVFYNRKCMTNYTLSVMYDYLKDSSITNICNSHGMSRPAVTSLANDLRLMMLSDYNAHNRQEEHKLGSNVRCHHIQIDESKFGKRKNHRGHRVEGIWVFGMVECLVPINEADRFYTYTDHRTGDQELRPREERDENTGEILDNTNAYNDGNFFFARHQVVNHSLDFATVDQVQGNQGSFSGLPISGKIHTNMIESMWAPLKAFIKPRNRTKENCYKRILEYLWRSENAGNVKQCFERMIREVAMNSNPAERSAETEDWFTRGHDGNSPSVSARIAARDARRFEAWVERRRARDARELLEEEAIQANDSGEELNDTAETSSFLIQSEQGSPLVSSNGQNEALPTRSNCLGGRPRTGSRPVGRPRGANRTTRVTRRNLGNRASNS
ncbi:hypothetical protein G6F49_010938 [Rhizopus delemar]|nr:hypothetical protein G6F49_010938 [Rhizopus delemar]KAG1579270.1 hypothetical protein G6F48_011287 [Rhizopus delemar]